MTKAESPPGVTLALFLVLRAVQFKYTRVNPELTSIITVFERLQFPILQYSFIKSFLDKEICFGVDLKSYCFIIFRLLDHRQHLVFYLKL